ncbi:MAG TPA: hypothetical protein DDY86_02600 [Syntrophaceae bacterium]|nr:hypothetical protein [Syntrophaceae bacterium]
MADTIRELVIQSIIARAAVILHVDSPPSGYETNCGSNVFRARSRIDPSELPCVVIWPQAEGAENAHGQSRHRMPVKIEAIMAATAATASVNGEKLLGDLITCFTSPLWARTPDYIDSIVYQGGGYDAPEEGSQSVGVSAMFLVSYWSNIGDPYASDS